MRGVREGRDLYLSRLRRMPFLPMSGSVQVGVRLSGKVLHELAMLGSCLGPVIPSFRTLSGRLKFTVRRHEFNKDALSCHPTPGLQLQSQI